MWKSYKPSDVRTQYKRRGLVIPEEEGEPGGLHIGDVLRQHLRWFLIQSVEGAAQAEAADSQLCKAITSIET
ncbi:hypothetical protein XENORESO_013741 [Xenotaenia resolanae]|uniref:Uncharacterized protein n=1 Tax=Xenotaenia resolanae TaxID=208358 RepID=A0ABV0VZJ6_9TELE